MTMLLETGKILDTLHEETNSADLMVLVLGNNEAAYTKMEDVIRGREEVKEHETAEFLKTNAKYRRKGEDRWTNYVIDF